MIKKKYVPKPYEQMQYQGQRVQIDVKVVTKECRKGEFANEKLYQYTTIDEYSRVRFLKAYKEQSTYSSADFVEKVVRFFAKKRIKVECIQTDNGFEFTKVVRKLLCKPPKSDILKTDDGGFGYVKKREEQATRNDSGIWD